jgi:hypothetical protein
MGMFIVETESFLALGTPGISCFAVVSFMPGIPGKGMSCVATESFIPGIAWVIGVDEGLGCVSVRGGLDVVEALLEGFLTAVRGWTFWALVLDLAFFPEGVGICIPRMPGM